MVAAGLVDACEVTCRLRADFEATCFLLVLPPVDSLAVCFVLAIVEIHQVAQVAQIRLNSLDHFAPLCVTQWISLQASPTSLSLNKERFYKGFSETWFKIAH